MNSCTFLGILSVFFVASFSFTPAAADGKNVHPEIVDITAKEFHPGEKKFRVIEVTGVTLDNRLGKYLKKAMKQIQDDIRKEVEDERFHVRFIVVLKNAVRITGMSDRDKDVGAEQLKSVCVHCGIQYVIVPKVKTLRGFIAAALERYTSVAKDIEAAKEHVKNGKRLDACKMTDDCS